MLTDPSQQTPARPVAASRHDAVLTIVRPEARNALNQAILSALARALDEGLRRRKRALRAAEAMPFDEALALGQGLTNAARS